MHTAALAAAALDADELAPLETYIAPVYLGHRRPVATVSITGLWNPGARAGSLADLDALAQQLEQLPRDPIRLAASQLTAWTQQHGTAALAIHLSIFALATHHFAGACLQLRCKQPLTQHQGLAARIEALRHLLTTLD